MIDETIVVTVLEISEDKVRLGIEAPAEVPVHRREVWDEIRENGRRETRVDGGSCHAKEPDQAEG